MSNIGRFIELDIGPFVNNRGMTYEGECNKGNLTLGQSSLPAEVLMSREFFESNGVPFHFTYYEAGDNLEMMGQTIDIENITARRAHFFGASSNGSFYEDVYFLKDRIEVFKCCVHLSDIISVNPDFSDQCALTLDYVHSINGKNYNFSPRLWHYCIDFVNDVDFNQIRFEDNPFIHIFAITFEK
ncbi:hypothetical protein [Bacillus cereus group sp. N21]|uniref:hypothetical protein n=1 Tax=Bacillus cereus group sp. N21 TaxID=2794591 RepID=UPI0018F7A05D|nr:hypothetical protein [Bacillus cereus group sp. N21]MBJ8030425.1 hypothetical protein [Bacillus cereus group sp. N21]